MQAQPLGTVWAGTSRIDTPKWDIPEGGVKVLQLKENHWISRETPKAGDAARIICHIFYMSGEMILSSQIISAFFTPDIFYMSFRDTQSSSLFWNHQDKHTRQRHSNTGEILMD